MKLACQLQKLILFDGKVFNPDISLDLLIEYAKRKPSNLLCKKFKEEYGKELGSISLKDRDADNNVYNFASKFRSRSEKEAMFFKAASTLKTKPNVVFDVVLKGLDAVEYISQYAKLGGDDPKNINIVWVLNDVKVALDQNAKRYRTVDPEYLKFAHIGVAKTMKDIVDASETWQKVVNGDIWIVFNKRDVNVKMTTRFKRVSDKNNEYRAISTIDDMLLYT